MGNTSPNNQPFSNMNYANPSSNNKNPFEIFTVIPEPNVIFYHSTSPSNPSKSPQCNITSQNSGSFVFTLNNSPSNSLNNSNDFIQPNHKMNNNSNYSPKYTKRQIIEKELIELDVKTILKTPRKLHSSQIIYKNGWQKQKNNIPKEKHDTLFIYDWDDTLLCTSYFSPNGFFNDNVRITQREKYTLSIAEELVYDIILNSIKKGYVYIITNSGLGWVEYSCEKFYPSVVPLLENITIISARAEYEVKYPGDSKKWKMMAFDKLKKNFNKEHITNIICIGDSFIEIEAGHMLSDKFEKAVVKSVKFREKVNIEEMNKQLKLISEQFNKIYSYDKNLKIRVEKKKKFD